MVSDPLAAMQPDSPLVHSYRDSNVLLEYHVRRGDVEAAFRAARMWSWSTPTAPARRNMPTCSRRRG